MRATRHEELWAATSWGMRADLDGPIPTENKSKVDIT
jgi:hypothetical protein